MPIQHASTTHHDLLVAVVVLGFSRACVGMALDVAAPGQLRVAARLKMFLECEACFEDSIRRAVDTVEYVRDEGEADIRVRVALSRADDNVREYAVEFIGAGRFAGLQALAHVGGRAEDGMSRGRSTP
jgi:hypothetical protein